MSGYTIISGSIHDLNESQSFVESLDEIVRHLPDGWRGLFCDEGDVVVTRAPGRLDLMGGIADYSGSLVLELPVRNAVHVALQKTTGRRVRIVSLATEPNEPGRFFEIDLDELLTPSELIDYSAARRRFKSDPDNHWAAYVAGAFLVLHRERAVRFTEGASILIRSNVPEGKGVSSSAALEVAVMEAICAAFELEITAYEMALLCQKVENQIVGAPCGIMDQMTAVCGEKNRLLKILCQPAEVQGTLELPDELEIWGIDSDIRHAVSGADYGTVRTAAFMGYRMIAAAAGLTTQTGARAGHIVIDDPKWKGYLANITVKEFERDFAEGVPEQISGGNFLDRYDGITDLATQVDRAVNYPVAAATRHPIYEHARVWTFAALLESWRGIEQAPMLGDLMFQSNASYSRCGLGSNGTDEIVRLAQAEGPNYIFGAKITGGGSGGTVALLGRRGCGERINQIAKLYAAKIGRTPTIFSGSSNGARKFGHLLLRRN
jgi:galactokinase